MRYCCTANLEECMAKKAYPLRINEEIMKATQQWADDELRSLNAQIEYILRDALKRSGRIKIKGAQPLFVEISKDDESC